MSIRPSTVDQHVICLTDRSNPLSVMKSKLYRVVTPYPSDPPTDVRILDEVNEDYRYPRDRFAPLDLPKSILKALNAT